uniref:uncharacterized protein LOC120335784 isoform X2 n=1 Tax=Styela clava TaxID=7725 RepID=UPI00193AC346|nr:uncharacterized protein LOC120335784 isoform X2 [Styela clava]
MKVGLARDVLSWKVGQCLSEIPGAEGTSEYILMMDSWFKIVNCNARCPIRSMDDVRIKWLDEFAELLVGWKNDALTHHKEPKRVMAIPTLEGLVFTSKNFIHLCERLLSELDYVCFHTFTQDVLEAFFGNLRQLGSRGQNPDIAMAAYGISHITQRRIIKKIKGGNTTYGKVNGWTTVCNDPLPIKKSKYAE